MIEVGTMVMWIEEDMTTPVFSKKHIIAYGNVVAVEDDFYRVKDVGKNLREGLKQPSAFSDKFIHKSRVYECSVDGGGRLANKLEELKDYNKDFDKLLTEMTSFTRRYHD